MTAILSVASECVPLVKTGGLADVVGALPKAVAASGWRMRVLLPAYPGLPARLERPKTVWQSADMFGGPAKVLAGRLGGAEFLLLDAPHLYDRAGGIYLDASGRDHADNPERFAALSLAAALIARDGLSDGWTPRIVHAHDWQAALAPVYMRLNQTPARTVLTIHNIAFQGLFPWARLKGLGLPQSLYDDGVIEYWGKGSALKAGIVLADRLTTVSPTYARELMREEFGMGLHGVIAGRKDGITGILNGIDDDVWNPETDSGIATYSHRSLSLRQKNRASLLREFGLGRIEGPLAIVVSRLTDQKGLDLLPEALPPFLAAGGGIVILGAGDGKIERALASVIARHPDRAGLRLGYDEALSHRMFGAGDAVLVPSRFEPCGLTQMYGLRYGCLPVVNATGGLADTVIAANRVSLDQGVATGLMMYHLDVPTLAGALLDLVRLHADRRLFAQLQRNGMKQDLGWARSGAEYADTYASLLRQPV